MFHPPYFPDIASSDSYLFGIVKQRPQTCQGQSVDELQEKVHEILSFPEPDELEATMRAWMDLLWRAIALSGE
jgi:hypothetical protein